MKQRPILFNSAMVRAILSGQKTQTRRIVKPHGWTIDQISKYEFINVLNSTDASGLTCEQPAITAYAGFNLSPNAASPAYFKSPYGTVCDQLWVRETFGLEVRSYGGGTGEFYAYKATKPDAVYCKTADGGAIPIKWVPSIHMPRKASRITLEITSVRVERLQDITEEDALAEGAKPIECDHKRQSCNEIGCYVSTAKAAFRGIWESTGSEWEANPWVWVIGFKEVK